MSMKADNYTRFAKAISRGAYNYTTSPRSDLTATTAITADCFFFCAEAFCIDAEAFCPEPAGAWRTSAQGSGAF
jgi:hypothetical protein